MKIKLLLSMGAAVATLFGGLVGTVTNAAASPAKATLVWWTWTANPQKVIANFEKAYPNITVKMPASYGSGTPFYAKPGSTDPI